MKIRLLIGIICLVMTGCAIKPLTVHHSENWQQRLKQLNSITQWSVKGRISIKTPDHQFSANLSWKNQPNTQHLLFYGSFGTSYAEFFQENAQATLTLPENKVYQSDSLEPLLKKVLGYHLPFEKLKYWIKGMADPDNGSQLVFDERGYLQKFRSDPWTISYQKYQRSQLLEQIYLPKKINITDGVMTLKLSLRDWGTGDQQ